VKGDCRKKFKKNWNFLTGYKEGGLNRLGLRKSITIGEEHIAIFASGSFGLH
jgi:hypothetical protein